LLENGDDLEGASSAFTTAKAICASVTGEKSRFFSALVGINEVLLVF